MVCFSLVRTFRRRDDGAAAAISTFRTPPPLSPSCSVQACSCSVRYPRQLPCLSAFRAFHCLAIFSHAGIISELAEDNQTLSIIEDELPFSGDRLVASCCADQFDAKHLKSEVDWLTTFIVSLHMPAQLCHLARQARAPPPQVLQSIALGSAVLGCCRVFSASSDLKQQDGASLAPFHILPAMLQPLASVGAAGLVKWLIYASLFNKLRYWGMLETDVDSAFTSSYVFGEFGPLNEAELPGHMLAQVKRIGGNASRNMFLVLLLILSGGRLDLVAQLALPVVAVVATFMTIPSSLVTMFMHGQRVDLFTGYLDTVEVPPGAGPGTDYNNLTWTGTANAGLEPNERQNLLLADWVFIPSMLTVLLLGVVVVMYGVVSAVACSACGRTKQKEVSQGLTVFGVQMTTAGCGAAVCCSLIAAPLLGVAATQYRDSWPEGETYLSFTEAQFSPDASRAAFEGALVPLIVLMSGLPVLGVCIALVVRLVASPEDAEAALRSNPALARASQVPGA